MKAAFTADIHYGTHTDDKGLEEYVEDLNLNNAGLLVIGGDLASRGATHREFKEALNILQKFEGEILFTPGNHDLWTRDVSSFDLLVKGIPDIFQGTNLHLLDGMPFVVGDTAIVGSVGWYDYTMRFVPRDLCKLFSRYTFRFHNSSVLMGWNELSLGEYESKVCEVSEDGENWKKSTWMDKNHIKWDFDDYRFTDYCLDQLRKDLESAGEASSRIIVITHHLPFSDFVPYIPDPTWSFHRAYLGSEKLGQLIKKYPKVKQVYFGHSHRNTRMSINGIQARNLYFPEEGGTEIIEF